MSALRFLSPRPLFLLLVVLAALWLAVLPPAGLSIVQARTLGIVLVTLVLWSTGLVPGYLASLLLFAVAIIAHLATPEVVFAGFGSTAVWLIVSGFVIGSAIGISGWGARLAEAVGPVLMRSYPVLIGGLMAVSMLLGFVMPSSVGRAVVMVPIGMAIADRCGFGKGSNGRIAIASVLAIGCNVPSFAILPSNIPNMIFSGAAETIWQQHFGYMEYLVLHYPVMGVLKSALAVVLILRLFPAEIGAPLPEAVRRLNEARPRDRAAEIRVAVVLLVTLALWVTDSLHGVNPAWVGLGTAIVLLMPGVGVVTPTAFKGSVDFGILLFVTGALALGAMVNGSGLGAMLGHKMEAILPLGPGRDFVNFMSLTVMTMVTGLFSTVPGAPAVLTPMAQDLADVTGLSLPAVLMTQVVGFSSPIFPYQVGPLVVAMQLSGEKIGALARVTIPLALISLVGLAPVDFLWWKLLGWI